MGNFSDRCAHCPAGWLDPGCFYHHHHFANAVPEYLQQLVRGKIISFFPGASSMLSTYRHWAQNIGAGKPSARCYAILIRPGLARLSSCDAIFAERWSLFTDASRHGLEVIRLGDSTCAAMCGLLVCGIHFSFSGYFVPAGVLGYLSCTIFWPLRWCHSGSLLYLSHLRIRCIRWTGHGGVALSVLICVIAYLIITPVSGQPVPGGNLWSRSNCFPLEMWQSFFT